MADTSITDERSFYEKVYTSYAIMHGCFFLIYSSLVMYISCRLGVKLDKFSTVIVLCFIFGFGCNHISFTNKLSIVKFGGWLFVSLRIQFVENYLIAYSLEVLINAVFFLILDIFIFKM